MHALRKTNLSHLSPIEQFVPTKKPSWTMMGSLPFEKREWLSFFVGRSTCKIQSIEMNMYIIMNMFSYHVLILQPSS